MKAAQDIVKNFRESNFSDYSKSENEKVNILLLDYANGLLTQVECEFAIENELKNTKNGTV